MYNTEGVDAVATITELRADTAELVEHARRSQNGILIQKNNRPYAVLLAWETYVKVKEQTDIDLL
jgi:prevent-host-death family protein